MVIEKNEFAEKLKKAFQTRRKKPRTFCCKVKVVSLYLYPSFWFRIVFLLISQQACTLQVASVAFVWGTRRSFLLTKRLSFIGKTKLSVNVALGVEGRGGYFSKRSVNSFAAFLQLLSTCETKQKKPLAGVWKIIPPPTAPKVVYKLTNYFVLWAILVG